MQEAIKQMLTNFVAKIDLMLISKTFFEILLFIIILKIGNKFFHLFFNKIIEKVKDVETVKHYETLRQIAIYIIDALIALFFITNILQNFGIDMKPILATAGVLGVAVGFGGKRFVEDLITGLIIILTGQLRVGDFVTVNNSTGTVEKVTLTMIVLRAYNGDVHYLRNGQIDTVVNQTQKYSTPVFNVGVSYNSDVNHVINVLTELGEEIRKDEKFGKYILSDILVTGLNEFQDSAIVIQCKLKTTPQEQWMVKRKFNQMIKERFDREGIEIPFPQVVVNKPKETV